MSRMAFNVSLTLYTPSSSKSVRRELFENFVRGIQEGANILNDLEFALFETNENGEVITAKYQGVGYL
jgi:hypothetical protein